MTEEDAIQAAELALGVLDGTDRAAALRRMVAEPAFAREVERWRDRFAALHGEWAEAQPADHVRQRVLGTRPAVASTLRRWQMAAGLASSVAAALLVVVLVRSPPTAAPAPAAQPVREAPALVAVLQPKEGDPIGAVIGPDRRDVRLSGAVTVPADRAAELWAIGGDQVPHAVGVMTAQPKQSLRVGPGVSIGAGVTLALSIEPSGGSPKPTPTGPVVATGTLVAL